MELLLEDNGINDRKLVKSQLERRRRERINCSLERLRTMLLQETQQTDLIQRRVEKADILEQTVLFLQTTTGEDRSRGRQQSFQDGFSTCLQRASHFLGPRGKELEVALNAATHFTHPGSGGPKATSKFQRFSPSAPSQSTQSKSYHCTPHVKDTSKHRPSGPKLRTGGCAQSVPVHRGFPGVVQQSQRLNHLEVRVLRQPSTSETNFQNLPVGQSLWRPWP